MTKDFGQPGDSVKATAEGKRMGAEAQVDAILNMVRAEVLRAVRRNKPLNSPHEAYAIIQEEVDELWDEVKKDNGRELSALEEATQVAAMAVRYVMDMSPSRGDV